MNDRLLGFSKNEMSVFSKYESFILGNVSQVNAIESGLRSLTYVLPGRFSDSELASEALFSVLNLVGLYHDNILTKVSSKPTNDGVQTSNFNRYTRSIIDSSPFYKRCAYLLSVIEYSEVLLEMLFLKRRGAKGKYNMIALIELIKMFLRLSLFKLSKKRTLLSPPHPEREQPPLEDDSEAQKRSKGVWQGKRTGYSHPKISSLQKNGTNNLDYKPYILSKVLDRDTACKSDNLVSKLEGLGSLAEILYIVRPVAYVLALRKFGLKSWTPWAFSLFLEWMSLHLKNKYLEETGRSTAISSLEKEEKRRRTVMLGYYLLKSPFFELITKPFLLKFCEKTKNKFLLSFLAGMISDYIPLWEKFHFYTSGS